MSIRWDNDDIEVLSSLAGDLPWPMVPRAFNAARPHKRTEIALRRKAEQMGLLRACVGEFISAGVLAQSLNTSYERIRRWAKGKSLPYVRFGSTRAHAYWFRRSDLRAFAQRQPELFGGLSEAQLVQLLSNERLAKELCARQIPRKRTRFPVECVETGVRWSSMGAAAKAAYVTKQRMRYVVRNGGTINGRRYRLAE